VKTAIWRTFIGWALWPLGIALYVAAVFYLADMRDPTAVSRVVGLGSLAVLLVAMALEPFVPYRTDWKLSGDRDVWRNLGHTLLHVQVGMQGATLLIVFVVAPFIARFSLPGIWPTQAPYLLQVLLVMVLGDGLMYWWHRLAHRLPRLWAVHSVHHMPQRVNTLMAGRHHVFYAPLGQLFIGVPLLLVGLPTALFAWQVFSIVVVQSLSHADVEFRIPRFMHRVLVTPQYHRLHHSADPGHANANFALMLPLWDILFGTFWDPADAPVPAVGIEGDPIPHRFMTELASPFNVKRWTRASTSSLGATSR